MKQTLGENVNLHFKEYERDSHLVLNYFSLLAKNKCPQISV